MKNGYLSMPQIYTMVILLSLVASLYQPSIGTIIPSIVKREEFVAANSINSVISNIGNILAPVVAGLIFGIYGVCVVIIINAISFITAGILEIFINVPKLEKKPGKFDLKGFGKDFKEGISFIAKRKQLINIIILAPIINFVFSPLFSTGFITITKKILRVTDSQYGTIQMILVGAMLLSPYFMAKVYKKASMERVLFLDILISAILIGIMAIIPSSAFLNRFSSKLIPTIILVVVSSLCTMVMTTANIALGTLFQKVVPLTMMGRVGSVMNSCCLISIPVGQILFGKLFDDVNISISISIAAIILFIAIIIFGRPLLAANELSNVKIENVEG